MAVIVLFPIVGNIFQVPAANQFVIQDYILQMKNVGQTDYEIVSKYYESVLEREGHYQEYHYFSKQVHCPHADRDEQPRAERGRFSQILAESRRTAPGSPIIITDLCKRFVTFCSTDME